jgi:hypothetical protein
MDVFFHIIDALFPSIDVRCNAYENPTNRNNIINIDFIDYGFLNSLYHARTFSMKRSKFEVLKTTIYDNYFVSDSQIYNILNKFCLAQKRYNALCRFAYLYKLKKAITFDSQLDFYLTPFNNLSPKILISLLDNGTIYQFRITDLIQIINSALSNSPEFFTEPLEIRNPYTNIPFSNANLYNIYFFIKESTFIMPTLFHLFFTCKFNLMEFSIQHENIIRDIAIDNFVKSATEVQKLYYILYMLEKHGNSIRPVLIHNSFPKEKIVHTFEYMLKPFLHSIYSLNISKKKLCKNSVKLKLRKFAKLNPTYGRKVFNRSRRSDIIHTYLQERDNSLNFVTSTPQTSQSNDVIQSQDISFNIGVNTSNQIISNHQADESYTNYHFIDTIYTSPPNNTPRNRLLRRRLRTNRNRAIQRAYVNLPYVFEDQDNENIRHEASHDYSESASSSPSPSNSEDDNHDEYNIENGQYIIPLSQQESSDSEEIPRLEAPNTPASSPSSQTPQISETVPVSVNTSTFPPLYTSSETQTGPDPDQQNRDSDSELEHGYSSDGMSHLD